MLKSKGQRAVIWIGLLIFLLLGIFPPWREVLNYGDGRVNSHGISFSFIADPPDSSESKKISSIEIDTTRLLVEWACVIATVIGMIVLFDSTRRKRANPPGFKH